MVYGLEVMLKNTPKLLSVLLLGLPAGGSVAAQDPPTTPQVMLERPRVVGEPRSEAEMEAWQAIVGAEDSKRRGQLAHKFLRDYPDSGLTAHANRVLAHEALDRNDLESFILYGEESLIELPDTPELLAPLANLYSEKGEAAKAIEYATRALPLLDESGGKVEAMSSTEWVTFRQRLRASAHYALGRSHLEVWSTSSPRPPEPLKQAVEHLNRALEMEPENGYAAFRLGFAEGVSRNPEGAVLAYARAAIVEGPAAGPARKNLEKRLQTLQKNPQSKWAQMSVKEVLEEERERLEAQLAEREETINRLAAKVDTSELLKTATSPQN